MSVDKKSMTREEIIKWRLGNMTKIAEEVRWEKDLTKFAKDNKYIKIRGEAYRSPDRRGKGSPWRYPCPYVYQ